MHPPFEPFTPAPRKPNLLHLSHVPHKQICQKQNLPLLYLMFIYCVSTSSLSLSRSSHETRGFLIRIYVGNILVNVVEHQQEQESK